MKNKNTISALSESDRAIVKKFIEMALKISRDSIKDVKTFRPFGMSCGSDGKVTFSNIGDNIFDKTEDEVNALRKILGSYLKEKKSLAVALIYDVRYTPTYSKEKIDAICIDIKIVDVFENRFFYPYIIKKGSLESLEPDACDMEGMLF